MRTLPAPARQAINFALSQCGHFVPFHMWDTLSGDPANHLLEESSLTSEDIIVAILSHVLTKCLYK